MAKGDRPPVPPQFSDVPPTYAPSSDYSFLEIIMAMQGTLGKLTEAVDSLKEQSKKNSEKLDDVRMDVHGAKAGAKTLMWVVGLVGALLGIILAAYFRKLFA